MMSRRRGAAWSLAIFAVLLAIYALSTVRTSYDSRWSLHTAMSLVRGHGGDGASGGRSFGPQLEQLTRRFSARVHGA